MVLNQRQKIIRRNQSPFGVNPAYERFRPNDFSGFKVYLWLVEEPKLCVLQCSADIGYNFMELANRFIVIHIKILTAVPPALLCGIHGLVGLSEYLISVERLFLWIESNPYACCDLKFPISQ